MRGFFLKFSFDLPVMRVVEPTKLGSYASPPSGQACCRQPPKLR